MLSCGEETITSVELTPTAEIMDCLYRDCAVGTNPNVIEAVITDKSLGVSVGGLQEAFAGSLSEAEHIDHFSGDGFPAWNSLVTIEISDAYAHHLVPVYTGSSDRVEAVISFFHYKEAGRARIDYIDREDISTFLLEEELLGAIKAGESISHRFSAESAVILHAFLDDTFFGAYDGDLDGFLNEENNLSNKDCTVTVRYLVTTTWANYRGGTFVGYDQTTSYEWGKVGCGGANGSQGPVGGGSGGGSSDGGSNGSGTIIINLDPNDDENRCVEDGIGCDDVDEEEEKEDKITIDDSMNALPCAKDLISRFLLMDFDFSEQINSIFDNPSTPTISITFESRYIGTSNAITSSDGGARDGIVFLQNTTITFNNAHPTASNMNNCTQDGILSTIIHELIHAQIQYLKSRDGFVTLVNPTTGDAHTITDLRDGNEHSLMAEASIPLIESMLIANNSNLGSLYEDTGKTIAHFMAWGGLQETTSFSSLSRDFQAAVNHIGALAECEGSSAEISSLNFIRCSD